MNLRAAALIALVTVLVVLTPAAPAGAVTDPAPGTTIEVQTEFDARLDGTPDGLLLARGAYGAVQRTGPGGTTLLASGISDLDLVAWDPATDDAIVTTRDGRVLRIADGGALTTIASGLPGLDAVDVADDGSVYVAHDRGVTRIAPDGTTALVIQSSLPTALAVEDDDTLLLGYDRFLYRWRAGEMTQVSANYPCRVPHPCGDGGALADAAFDSITELDVGDDGSIYVADRRDSRIRVVRPDGAVSNLLGSFHECLKDERYDCLPTYGPRTPIQKPLSMALSGGDLYLIDGAFGHHWTRLLRLEDAEHTPPYASQGYRMIASDGGVFSFGWSPFYGSTGDIRLASPIVAGRSNGPDGYWFVAADGGVFTFGNARFFGSAAGTTQSPVVDIAVVSGGGGYYIAERNGRVHALGDAGELAPPRDPGPYAAIVARGRSAQLVAEHPSSLPHLNQPIVAAHSTKSATGTWYVAADGGVFTEGDAGFFGSTGAMRLNQPVLDLIPTPTERGYWLIAADGGVFTFGDAEFLGSMGAVRLNRPVVAGVAGPVSSG